MRENGAVIDSDADGLPADAPASLESATVRRSPRYLRFIVVAAVVGVIVAAVLTLAFPENPEYGRVQTFGFLALMGAAVFGVIGAITALILDRSARTLAVRAEHEVHDPTPGSG